MPPKGDRSGGGVFFLSFDGFWFFDRIYFYGSDKPVHISYSVNYKKEIIVMNKFKNRLVPKKIKFNL